jgi:SAM-dependent methyltransferase
VSGAAPEPSAALTLTGERTLPGIWHENYWFTRHLAAYAKLGDWALAGPVLEAGCGEGYGADLLRERLGVVVALDYDAAAAAHVRTAYPSVSVARGNVVALPLRDGSVGSVVSLQTVEHLWDQHGYVAECVRVLAPGGLLAVSTPNRLTFSPGAADGERPRNPFHTKEFDPVELFDLIGDHASVRDLVGLRHGARIKAYEAMYGSVVEAQLRSSHLEWPSHLSSLVASLGVDDFAWTRADLAGCLDLLAVAAR